MEFNDLILELENVSHRSKILRATLFMVNEQFCNELDTDSQIVLDGICESVLQLDILIQKLTAEGFAMVRGRRCKCNR